MVRASADVVASQADEDCVATAPHSGTRAAGPSNLRVVVAEEQWDETQHELQRRIGVIVEQGRLTDRRP